MNCRHPDLDPELEALLKRRRIERHAPPELRARVIARGRAIVAAGGRIPPAPLPEIILTRPLPTARGRRLARIAAVASVVVAGAAVGAVGAFQGQGSPPAPTALGEPPPVTVRTEAIHVASPEPVSIAPPRSLAIRAPRSARSSRDGAPSGAELDLVSRAQAAYTRRDFSRALTLVADHARRFPRGHLAEEREALRVRSLMGSGRTEEGHRAAAAFALRFPRSVLLARVEGAESAR